MAKAKNDEFIVRPSSNSANAYVLSCLHNNELCHYLLTVTKNGGGETKYMVDSSKHKNLIYNSALEAATALGLKPMVCDDDTDDEEEVATTTTANLEQQKKDDQAFEELARQRHQHRNGCGNDDDDGDATLVVVASPRTRRRAEAAAAAAAAEKTSNSNNQQPQQQQQHHHNHQQQQKQQQIDNVKPNKRGKFVSESFIFKTKHSCSCSIVG